MHRSHSREAARRARALSSCRLLALLASSGCDASPPTGGGPPCAGGPTTLHMPVSLQVTNNAIESADVLFVIDNSAPMRDAQVQLARQFDVLLSQLVSPPVDPMTMAPQFSPVKSLSPPDTSLLSRR